MKMQPIFEKLSLRPQPLKYTVLGCGAAGFALYRLLYATGMDGRDLLIRNHPAWVGLCILAIALGAVILCSTAGFQGTGSRFPRSIPAGIGCILAATASAYGAWINLPEGNVLYTLPALLAAVSFAAVAFCRFRELKPYFLLHVVICANFVLQTLNLYQHCNFDPQIQGYLFQILSCVGLSLTAYQLAHFDLGKGSHRWLWTIGLCTVFLCAVSMGTSASGMYITGGIWAFTNLSDLRLRRKTG